jgi:hypothetical protein
MTATILNPGNRYQPAFLIEPRPAGYVHIGAAVDPPARPGPAPLTARVRELLALQAPLLRRLAANPDVHEVGVYRAIGFPPLAAFEVPDRYKAAVARYNLEILIESTGVAALQSVQDDPAYRELLSLFGARAIEPMITVGHNVRRIADVPADGRLHLFNHFLTDREDALEVWDYLAGWYQREMRLTNSEVIAPNDPGTTPFAFINHASWNMGAARFIARQLSRRSFRSFVIANLRANDIWALPYLYRPVAHGAPRDGAQKPILSGVSS